MSEQKFIARNYVYIKYFDTSIIARMIFFNENLKLNQDAF